MATYMNGQQTETKYDKNGNILSSAPMPQQPQPQPQMAGYVNQVASKPVTTLAAPTINPSVQGYQPPQTSPYGPAAPAPAKDMFGRTIGANGVPVNGNAAQIANMQPAPGVAKGPLDLKVTNPTGATTEAGRLAASQTLKGLQGKDPTVINAQNIENSAAQGRQYQGTKNTQESLAQSPFAIGSAQYSRAMDRNQAGINTANQAGQAGVNAYTRERTNDNLNAANALETQTYNRGETADNKTYERGQTADTTAYNRGRDVKNDELAAAAVKKTDNLQVQNLLGTANGKIAFSKLMSQPGMTTEKALASLTDEKGALKPEYAGMSPGVLGVQGAKDEAGAWVTATTNLKPGQPGYDEAVQQRLINTDTATQGPNVAASEAANLKDLNGKLSTGKLDISDPKNADDLQKLVASGDIESFGAANAPLAGKADEMAGKTIVIDGKFYKVVKGSQPRTSRTDFGNARHTDVGEMKGADGKKYYFYDGTMHNKAPGTVS